MSEWKFDFDEMVVIDMSGQIGKVVGRAQYVYAEPSYLIRLVESGVAREAWWTESALKRGENQ